MHKNRKKSTQKSWYLTFAISFTIIIAFFVGAFTTLWAKGTLDKNSYIGQMYEEKENRIYQYDIEEKNDVFVSL